MTYFIALLCLSFAGFANATAQKIPFSAQAPILDYTIITERSHKPDLFTEGLLIDNGYFYESSGRYAKSLLVSYPIIEPQPTGEKRSAPFNQKKSMPKQYFAEGLAKLNNKLYQLTWKEGALFVYDARTLTLVNTLHYTGEGWGLTSNGKQLIRSDGSNNLFFHNALNFAVEKTLAVHLNQEPINNLNELEYSEGFIWANIWQDNRILKINPATGDVVGVVDLSTLAKNLPLNDPESVLNGIAYDADKKALWVTGKQWPKMFLLKII